MARPPRRWERRLYFPVSPVTWRVVIAAMINDEVIQHEDKDIEEDVKVILPGRQFIQGQHLQVDHRQAGGAD